MDGYGWSKRRWRRWDWHVIVGESEMIGVATTAREAETRALAMYTALMTVEATRG